MTYSKLDDDDEDMENTAVSYWKGVKQGWVTVGKKGRIRNVIKWKSRWVALSKFGKLYTFKQPADPKFRMQIDVQDIASLESIGDCSFGIIMKDSRIILQFLDQQQRNHWWDAIVLLRR